MFPADCHADQYHIEPLLQVGYCLSIIIVDNVLNAIFNVFIYVSIQHYLLMQSVLLIFGLSVGFCSYYLYHLPANRPGDYLVAVMVLGVNGLVGAGARRKTQMALPGVLSTVPQNTPVESSFNSESVL